MECDQCDHLYQLYLTDFCGLIMFLELQYTIPSISVNIGILTDPWLSSHNICKMVKPLESCRV
jgi:hypothetical protein